ncbi:MAG: transglutaminase domain-containing protein [Proteobacteria bacterium]|nr:transglutaminase domain-containing protein [Pseudomonadota bacterium]
MSKRLVVAGSIAIVGFAIVAIAQTPDKKRPVIHEDLTAPVADKAGPMISSGGSGVPTAFAAGDKVLPKPALDHPSSDAAKGEPVYGKAGMNMDRHTGMKPDNKTGTDGTLHYASVFNPDVLPFKRMSAFDGVSADYTFKVAHTALVDVTVGGVTDKTRDRFWGSLTVELAPGKDVALPSVAPDMRILSYETKPAVRLRFEKDGADNFFVRSDESSTSGSYRLVFLADADAGYFAPQLPAIKGLTPAKVAARAPGEIKVALDDRIRSAARRTHDRLGIDADTDLNVAFNKMVSYFRAFSAKDPPASSDDIYRDLCDSQAGVCRHRSFAFVITANALGIPTRYVENEAHAFVEVWFPERGWQRIDLGGAALHLEVTGAENKTLHRPRAEDPFAKPVEYRQNYTQLEGDITGLTKQQLDDKRKSLDQAPSSGSFGPNGGGGGGGAGGSPDRITPDPTLPAVTMDPKKKSPHLMITLADTSAYRGDMIHVEGKVDVGGKGLPDHSVDVYLAPAGENGKNSLPSLGRVVTAADGTFRGDFEIPGRIELASYEIYLSSPEDASFNAGLSN